MRTTRGFGHPPAPRAWVALLVIFFAGVSPAHAQGVQVALVPSAQAVSPGDTVSLDLMVTEAGSTFNGCTAIVSYDTTELTFLPTSPTSLQEGSYMTGACGNTFHNFAAAADSLSITDVLLCANTFLPGPGQIYQLRFICSNVPNRTEVHIRRVEFYHGGTYVTPVSTSDAVIGIGDAGVAEAGSRLSPVLVRAAPNPSRSGTTLTVETRSPGIESLWVCDVLGRTVRHLQSGSFAGGRRAVTWDGRDDAGALLRPGVYMVKLRTSGQTAATRITILH